MKMLAAKILSLPYAWAVRLRNFFYDLGWKRSYRLPRPVISIGNLTFGGTGKTPMTVWIAKFLANQNLRAGILSRGYRGDASGQNEEGRMIAALLPDIPHIQNPDRVRAGKELIEKENVDAILLDDGFQHLRLRRDLNLLLIDATNPFGGGACPPLGRLREGFSSIRRADLVILTRADCADAAQKKQIWETIRTEKRAELPFIEAAFPTHGILDTETQKLLSLQEWQGAEVNLLSAIGNPKAFRLSAEKAGFRITREFRFRDHHHYSEQELKNVFRNNSQMILTTYKDWMKIQSFPGFHPWVMMIEAKFLCGEEILRQHLMDLQKK